MASELVPSSKKYAPTPRPIKPINRTILVLYRSCKPQNFDAGSDHWMFLDLESAHYGLCGYSLDCVMLMDGITKVEVITVPAWVGILPNLKPDAVVMEAG